MISFDNLITYHGTSESVADDLVVGNVQISRGGGELGKGFYLGTQLHVAKAWAKQMHNSQAVVEFCTFEERFRGPKGEDGLAMSILVFDGFRRLPKA